MTRPVRLLLVDDNSDDRLLARRMLERHFAGIDIVEADDQKTLGAALADFRFDAVITDYSLGFSNGLVVLEAIKARDTSVPVIMFTITGSEEICAEGMKKGLFDYILKRREYYARLPIAVQSGIDLAETKARLATRERELQERADQLAEANRRKDEFLAMLAHELRNPLAPLRNAVTILKLKGAEPTIAQVSEMMDRQVSHLARLVDDLLDVSRVTRGRVALRKEAVDLAALVRTVVDDRRGTFEAAGVTLIAELPDANVSVEGDPARLTQIVDNLLDNAIKFSDRGDTARVSLAVDEQAREALTSVSDTGIGIEPDLMPHLFDAFVQADRSLERTRGGLGLGLALTKGFVELHGGRMEVSSAGAGRGARFTVALPLHNERPALLDNAPPVHAGRRQLRVLVIEDNRDAADSLQALLELLGYVVSVAYSGDEGLKSALQLVPDAIVCDIGLPGMDGYAVARALRADARTHNVRLLALTGYGDEADKRQALDAGFDEHLVKPADPRQLARRLEIAA